MPPKKITVTCDKCTNPATTVLQIGGTEPDAIMLCAEHRAPPNVYDFPFTESDIDTFMSNVRQD